MPPARPLASSHIPFRSIPLRTNETSSFVPIVQASDLNESEEKSFGLTWKEQLPERKRERPNSIERKRIVRVATISPL